MKRLVYSLGFIALAFFNTNCSVTDSENVKTDGLYVTYNVAEKNGEYTADASFFVGGPTGTVVELSENDTVEVNGRSLRREKDLLTNKVYYSTKMGDFSGNFRFTFIRQTEDGEEVYESDVSIPRRIGIIEPGNGDTFFRGEPITVRWRRGTQGDKVRVEMTGTGKTGDGSGDNLTYTKSSKQLINDSGRYTFSSTDTNPTNVYGNIRNVQISVTRVRDGFMSHDLKGTITATTSDDIGGITLRK